jgi:hypothetical protein
LLRQQENQDDDNYSNPDKPWKATKRERLIDLSIFFLALLSSYLIVAVTEMKGKLALFVVFFVAYMLFTSSIKGFQLGSAAAKDALVNSLVAFGAIVTVIPIASILFTVVKRVYLEFHLTFSFQICRWQLQQIHFPTVVYCMR